MLALEDQLFLKFIFILCGLVFCLNVCMWTVPGAHRGQKRKGIGFSGPGVRTVVSHNELNSSSGRIATALNH